MSAISTSPKMSLYEADLHSTTLTTSPQPSPRLNSPGPTPLPDFQFPARGPSTMSSSAPSSYSRATGRKRPVSAVEIHQVSMPSSERLPAFSFGGQSSPTSPRNISGRPSSMHQRNTSEFIGGDGKTGAGEILSTSPTKSESALPLPQAALGPPAGRRGHAHRRSAAISVSDLNMILPSGNGTTRGSSAPNSPSVGSMHHKMSFSSSIDSSIQPAGNTDAIGADSAHAGKAKNTTRVGFSDNVEFIPRPLSMVSSNSSSTVRPGHSVSNSISSIMSIAASPQAKEKRDLPAAPRVTDHRPRTADPTLILDASRSELSPRRRSSLPLLNDIAKASATTPTTPTFRKKWSLFSHEPTSGDSSPKSRPTSSSSSKESKKAETVPSSPDVSTDNPMPTIEPTISRRSSLSRKPKKRVASWAGSVFSRKSRQRKQKLSRRSPTPPLSYTSPAKETSPIDLGVPDIPEQPVLQLQTNYASWVPRRVVTPDELSSPMIDLDAALGPLNTPSSSRFGEDWDISQMGGRRKRTMHSGGFGSFSGSVLPYHKRAESAPEFENTRPRFSNRLGSSEAMPKVFEEDESESLWEDAKTSDKASSIEAPEDDEETGLGVGIKVVDSEGVGSDSLSFEDRGSIRRKTSGLSEGGRHMSSNKSLHSTTSLVDESIEEETGSPVEIADDSFPSRPDSRAQSSDSTATPPFRANAAKGLAPVEIQPFSLQPPYQTTSPNSIPSSFPSPRSPLSYDAQRISTAPSSFTDENNFQSLLLGEPGPEVRMSVDDVPSLTSSNSTMTKESGHPGFNNPQFRDGARSASLSSTAMSRKRNSVVSLSRLLSSSHGEKSKLSTETRAPTPEGERQEKTSKGKRLSRMMQFWKPSKDKDTVKDKDTSKNTAA